MKLPRIKIYDLKIKTIFIFCLLVSVAESQNNLISFTENKGQVSDQYNRSRSEVLYSGSLNGMTFHLKKDGIAYQFRRVDSWKIKEDPKQGSEIKLADQNTIYRLDIKWLEINESLYTETDTKIEGYTNYYLANCPNGIHDVKSFSGITYKNIYENIDLHYYSKDGGLKYDYLVQPNSDYKQIRLEIKGAEEIILQKDGSIILKTPLGNIKEEAPLVYQNNKQLKSKWILTENILTFEIENYNPSFFLLIDPAIRVWGTYYGDIDEQYNTSTALDPSGNIYMGGYSGTLGSTYLATSGAHQVTCNGGRDGFLAKFTSSGARLWSTYYGGASNDYLNSCSTDPSGNIFVCGYTESSGNSVIATSSAHQSTLSGLSDAFLVKFNSNGIRQWATYYGDTSFEDGVSCSSDNSGNIYLAGVSQGNGSAISTNGSHQVISGGAIDAFLAKFDPQGIRLWATYYGGSGPEYSRACTVDNSGNVYLTGFTASNSGNAISTSNAHQPFYNGGDNDAFLVKFNNQGVRQWGTYYGGTQEDRAFGCSTDNSGNVYIAGDTRSYNFIASIGAHQINSDGIIDAFLVKFDNSGTRLWGTYYGGHLIDQGNACTCDASGNVYLVGNTTSQDTSAIATQNSHQTFNPGMRCAFLTKFDSDGLRQFGTFYCGANNTEGNSCVAGSSCVYLAGSTSSNELNVISTQDAFQVSFGGYKDAFLTKFTDDLMPAELNEFNNNELRAVMFPNPTKGNFEIYAPDLNNTTVLEIFNYSGTLISKQSVLTEKTKITLISEPSGIYFVKISDTVKQKIFKVIKD